MRNDESTQIMQKDHYCREAQCVTVVGMVFNLVLTAFKFVAGFVGNSAAMVADAVHSLSDSGTDVVTLVSLKLATKPCDDDHPYGHGKIETLATTIIGGVVIFAGVWIGRDSILLFLGEKQPYIPLQLALIAAVVSILVKEWLYHYTVRAGRRLNSEVVIANAWHHRTDAISSVATMIGIGLAIYTNSPMADSIASLVVSLLIIKVGFDINWKAIKALIDTMPEEEVICEIERHAKAVEGVFGTHGLKARLSGANLLVDIDIEVHPHITVAEGHNIAKHVKASILKEMPTVTSVMVHLDIKEDYTGEPNK